MKPPLRFLFKRSLFTALDPISLAMVLEATTALGHRLPLDVHALTTAALATPISHSDFGLLFRAVARMPSVNPSTIQNFTEHICHHADTFPLATVNQCTAMLIKLHLQDHMNVTPALATLVTRAQRVLGHGASPRDVAKAFALAGKLSNHPGVSIHERYVSDLAHRMVTQTSHLAYNVIVNVIYTLHRLTTFSCPELIRVVLKRFKELDASWSGMTPHVAFLCMGVLARHPDEADPADAVRILKKACRAGAPIYSSLHTIKAFLELCVDVLKNPNHRVEDYNADLSPMVVAYAGGLFDGYNLKEAISFMKLCHKLSLSTEVLTQHECWQSGGNDDTMRALLRAAPRERAALSRTGQHVVQKMCQDVDADTTPRALADAMGSLVKLDFFKTSPPQASAAFDSLAEKVLVRGVDAFSWPDVGVMAKTTATTPKTSFEREAMRTALRERIAKLPATTFKNPVDRDAAFFAAFRVMMLLRVAHVPTLAHIAHTIASSPPTDVIMTPATACRYFHNLAVLKSSNMPCFTRLVGCVARSVDGLDLTSIALLLVGAQLNGFLLNFTTLRSLLARAIAINDPDDVRSLANIISVTSRIDHYDTQNTIPLLRHIEKIITPTNAPPLVIAMLLASTARLHLVCEDCPPASLSDLLWRHILASSHRCNARDFRTAVWGYSQTYSGDGLDEEGVMFIQTKVNENVGQMLGHEIALLFDAVATLVRTRCTRVQYPVLFMSIRNTQTLPPHRVLSVYRALCFSRAGTSEEVAEVCVAMAAVVPELTVGDIVNGPKRCIHRKTIYF